MALIRAGDAPAPSAREELMENKMERRSDKVIMWSVTLIGASAGLSENVSCVYVKKPTPSVAMNIAYIHI